jgi:CheY-like chemotaxis protein
MPNHVPPSRSGVHSLRRRILVVDADSHTRNLVCSALQDDGYHVTSLATALEAIVLVTRGGKYEIPWDVAVMFLRGDEDPAIEVICRLVRVEQHGAIVAVTDGACPYARERADSIAAVAIWEPPFDMARLRRIVADALEGSSERLQSAVG